MPAARYRTKLQEADNHDKRAVELADKADVECVSNCLLVNPEAIRHVMNKLRSMGHDLGTIPRRSRTGTCSNNAI